MKAKRAGAMIQMVEHLPCKCKTLSSNPSTANKQTKSLCLHSLSHWFIYLLFSILFSFWETGSHYIAYTWPKTQYSLGRPWTLDPPASASGVWGLQVSTTCPTDLSILILVLYCFNYSLKLDNVRLPILFFLNIVLMLPDHLHFLIKF
jgi:hypothetical protein